MYHDGKGVPLDYAEAMRWSNNAADQGDAKAQFAIGYMYYYGEGVPPDHDQAARWFTKAAEAGDADAQNALGYAYYSGDGMPRNDAMAFRWYRKAAEQGNARAENDLAWMYSNGRGTPRDRAAALRWYRKAADDGDQSAQRYLARRISTRVKILLVVQVLCGALLSLSLFSLGSPKVRCGAERSGQFFVGGVGAFTVFCACLRWYGYTHYKVRTCAAGLNGFTVVQWILSAITIAALLYVVFSGKKAEQQSS